jgi:phosphate transport system permease protein
MATPALDQSALRHEDSFIRGLRNRHRLGAIWKRFFQAAVVFGLIALLLLAVNVLNRVFGYVAIVNRIEPSSLSDRPLEELSAEELGKILIESAGASFNPRIGLANLIPGGLGTQNSNYIANRENPIGELIPSVPAEYAAIPLGEITSEQATSILSTIASQEDLLDLIKLYVVGEKIGATWSLTESLFNRAAIDEYAAANPNAKIEFRNWLSLTFLSNRMSDNPLVSGIRIALLGTVWVLVFTILVAFPLGVGTAIYLQEYSTGDTWVERIIETNIRNLAGVPSIIYGLLGLAIFVRVLEPITQGRTVISAALTMSLLILPIIIINAQEALRAVPPSLREASFGLGATKWQTVWRSVLPAALPGILTGTILGMSRAIGETAPLVIIGAATFIATNPDGPLARFTVIPIQIYNWTKDARPGYGEVSAAAIVLLLIVLLTFNAIAIYLRQRFRRALQG